MQTVSDAWKAEQQKSIITAQSLLEVSMNMGDPEAQADAVASDNGHLNYSNVAEIVDGTKKTPDRYSTLENNLWLVDGTFEILPDSPPYGKNGYIGSVLSGFDGAYTSISTITITFPRVFTELIPGITIQWSNVYDEWATSFRVRAYNGSTITAEKTVTGNADVLSVVAIDIDEYDKITIEVLAWRIPSRRARVENVMIGVEKVYSATDIMNFSHSMFVDPLSAELPKAEIKFELKNLNSEYNPDNPSGVEKYLMERQAVQVRYGYVLEGEAEWLKAGTFFISEWDTPQNGIVASFTARDLLEYMSDKYTGQSSGTLLSIATAALTQAGLPAMESGENRWTLWSGLSGITAPSDVDLSKYTIAEVLQLVANAACCVFYQDREGILHVEPLAAGTTDYRIDQDNSYPNSEIVLTKQLKAVDINSGAATVSVGNAGETQIVENPLISPARAAIVAQWVANYLNNRRTPKGDWRADPRLDALDRVTVQNQFAESSVLVNEVEYTYNGAWRGSYEGRTDA